MKRLKRIVSLLITLAFTLSVVACSDADAVTVEVENNKGKEVKLVVWYTDAELAPYMDYVATKAMEENEKLKIENVLVKTDQYLENIYKSSIKENNGPDLFVMSSSSMEEAYLLGLMNENTDSAINVTNYGKTAIDAASFKGKLYGYPLTYNTAMMVYNTKLGKNVSDFHGLIDFSNSFTPNQDNASVEMIAQWNMHETFRNYALIGAFLGLTGDNGEDKSQLNYTRDRLYGVLNEVVELKKNLGISDELTSAECIEKFKNSAIIYTVVEAKEIADIEKSGVSYDISRVYDYNMIYTTKAMSETSMLIVNPYGANKSTAANYAKTLSYDQASYLFEKAGLLPARGDMEQPAHVKQAHEVYADTIVKSKLMKTGDTYLKAGVMINNVLSGTKLDDAITTFAAYMDLQWK